jgi:putative ABC transport system permease protein
MPPSLRLALDTLATRRGRNFLVAGAVVLAASLVVATSCVISSAQMTLEHQLTRFVGTSDARIIHQFQGRFDESLLDEVRRWPEVETASGRLRGALTLIGADGKRDEETGDLLRVSPVAYGYNFEVEQQLRDFALTSGRFPNTSNEILIDPLTADRLKVVAGDVLLVQRFGDPIELTISGIFDRPLMGAIQRPMIRVPLEMLADANGRQGQLSSIMIVLRKGQDVALFCDKYGDDLPEALSLEPSELVRTGFDRRIMASELGLVVASVLGFMSAAFIIVTGLTTSVTEKQRELAVLRCIGAARGQLFRAQLLFGVMLSAMGAVVGVPVGIGLAAILVWFFHDLMPAGLALSRLGIYLALIGSIGAGLLGAIYPAWLASQVPPLQAMTNRARPMRARSIALCAVAALALIGIHLLLNLPEEAGRRFLNYVYIGAPLVFLAYFILAVPVLVLVTWLLSGTIATVLRIPTDMLRQSVLATPFRHGLTAGALMVGMALLVGSWSVGTSVFDNWISQIRFADGFAYRTTGISPKHQEAIDALPFVQITCPIGYMPLRVIGEQVFGVEGISPPNVICVGFDPEVFFSINKVDWIQGTPETAIPRLQAGDAVIVAENFLQARGIGVGDRLTLGAGRTQKEFEIVGVVGAAGLEIATHLFGIRSDYLEYALSCVFMDWDTVVEVFDSKDAYMMQVNLDDTIDDEEASALIANAAPGVLFRSGRWIKTTINSITAALLTITSTTAFMALILACLGVGNVMLANIHARRYEYGVLRAIGAKRSLLFRLIAAEILLLAIAASLTGTALGLHAAWMEIGFYRDLIGLPVTRTIPVVATLLGWATLAAMVLLGVALPGALTVMRPSPSALVGPGANG